MILSRNVLLYGTNAPPPEQTPLQAGPLSVIFEDGGLRYIRLGGREVVRRIYVAVRDQHWGTVPYHILNLRLEPTEDAFSISFDANPLGQEIGFFWKGTITGNQQGTIRYEMSGVARSTFLRSRIGICVLYPIRECAGQPCVVEHTDGSLEDGIFPKEIAPHQPFSEIRAITHQIRPDVQATVRFEGDIFEMEDQRNWTDASYKIYSTPLSRPRPVEVLAGTQIGQSITLTLQGKLEAETAAIQLTNKSPFQPTSITIGESTGAGLPSIGLSVPDREEPWSNQTIELLRQLHLSHLRVTLQLFEPGYAISFAHAVNDAGVLGVPLEVALIVSNYAETELAQFVAALPSIQPDICRWLVFHRDERTPDERWLRLARKHLAKWKPHIPVGSGTLMNFAELNRARLATDQLDSIAYAINPQVHASDHTSLMETLEGQRETIRAAQKIAAGLPLVIGPIELKQYRRRHSGSVTLSDYDTRQLSLFGASWILGSLANACLYSHVQSVTFCDAIGWQGVILNGDEKALHPEFPIAEGQTFPLYYVLLTVGSYKTGKLVAIRSSKPAVLTGLAIQDEGRLCILLANLTSEVQQAVIHNVPSRVHLTCLDETSMADTTTWHTLGVENNSGLITTVNGVLDINFLPYSVVRIESGPPPLK